jgi:hypothetical protein
MGGRSIVAAAAGVTNLFYMLVRHTAVFPSMRFSFVGQR